MSSGRLHMTSEDSYVKVLGGFYMASSVNTSSSSSFSILSDGVLEVQGDFEQIVGSVYNFRGGGNHEVVFSGNGRQVVKFENPDNSYFNSIAFRNTSEEGVDFQTPVQARGTFKSNGSVVKNAPGGRLVEDASVQGSLAINYDGIQLNGFDLTLSGDLIHSGGLVNVDAGRLTVGGDYRIQSVEGEGYGVSSCLLYTSPSPRD